MRSEFRVIYERAVGRHGEEALVARLPVSATAAELAAISDDRWLSMMTRRVFQAGFVYRVIEAKWPGFEVAFAGFEPAYVASLGDAGRARLLADTGIVRNGQKIDATLANARFVLELSAEAGGFGAFVAAWPNDDIVGLWDVLKKRGHRLGGDTGPRFLRAMGKPTFVLTPDVVQALVDSRAVGSKPTSKKALAATQAAFNEWSAESGLDLSALSVVLACSVGEKYDLRKGPAATGLTWIAPRNMEQAEP